MLHILLFTLSHAWLIILALMVLSAIACCAMAGLVSQEEEA